MAMHDIGTATKLPMAVALEVVVQGVKIRLGRSMVTLAGVVCGIAFLASVLTGGVVKSGVAGEQAARDEAARMLALIEAESGPLRGRRVAVIAGAEPVASEVRLILACVAAGGDVNWSGPGMMPGIKPAADAAAAVADAVAVVVIGGPLESLGGVMPRASRQLVVGLAPPELPGVRSVTLAWTPKPGEIEERDRIASEERSRSMWVTGIALAVTAIGIANAMLMSVTERFREIGTMKCLGALSSFIRQIFFLESAFIGLVGGVVGVLLGALITILGYGASYGFALVMGGTDWGRLTVLLLLGIVASVVLAVGAAIYPATVASRMRPSAALRSSV